MKTEDDGCSLRNVCKVTLEPFHLIVGESFFVILHIVSSLVGEKGVIHHDVMDVADVEGIVKRIEVITETCCSEKVVCNGRVVVVIARRAIDGKVKVLNIGTIVLERVIVLIPILIPSQVTESESIKFNPLTFCLCNLSLDVRLEIFIELILVICTVCKMGVRPHEQSVLCVSFRSKHEVVDFVKTAPCRSESAEELWYSPVYCNAVILWCRDEHKEVLTF